MYERLKMIRVRRARLMEKGWTKKELGKAESLLNLEHKHDKHFSKIVFWSALIVIIFANLAVSLVLIPFLIVLNQWLLYSIIVILAGSIGFLYNLLITDINLLEKKHHISAGIIIPLLALANMVVVVFISNRFIADLQVNNPEHNLLFAGIVFAVAFILPYLISKVFSLVKKK